MSTLAVLAFEGTTVRTEMIDGEPWFCARDVGECLGLTKSAVTKAVGRLDPRDRAEVNVIHLSLTGPDQRRKMTFVSQSGTLAMAIRSDKPDARAFQRWLTHEVVPSIMKTGRYEATPQSPTEVIAAGWVALQAQVEVERELRLQAEASVVELAATVADQLPAVALEQAFTVAPGEKLLRGACKELHLREGRVRSWLAAQRHYYRGDGAPQPSVRLLDTGRVTVRTGVKSMTKKDGTVTEISWSTIHWTPKGRAWLNRKIPAACRA